MSRKTWEDLAWQLTRLPGGAEAAIPDFFGSLLATPPAWVYGMESWTLRDGVELRQTPEGVLHKRDEEGDTHLADAPAELIEVAREKGLSPLLLTLLGLATGDLPGDRRLKALLPKVDGAAKDLMLMTVCRLCG